MKDWLEMLKLININKKGKMYYLNYLFLYFIACISGSLEFILIKNLIESPNTGKALIIFVVTMSVGIFSRYLREYYSIKSMGIFNYEYCNIATKKILQLDYANYTSCSAGDFHTVLDGILKMLKLLKNIAILANCIVLIIVNTFLVYTIDHSLAVVIFMSIVILAIYYKKVSGKFDEFHDGYQKNKKELNRRVALITNSLLLIKTKNTEDEELDYINERSANLSEFGKCLTMTSAKASSVINIVFYVACIIIFFMNKLSDNFNPLVILTAISYLGNMINPIISILDNIDSLNESKNYYERYRELMSIEDHIKDGSISVESFDNNISFNNVSFKYKDGSKVLNNINLKVKKGEKIGICGKSGGGKSSLIYLINRLYDVTSGSIKLDGIDVKDITNNSLRKVLSYVSQDTIIIDGTIKDNISYGMKHISEVEIIEACKKANLYEFIQSLENGLDTIVGMKGLKLSGGQRQRISIARSFLQNAPILLLDEATSALDNESETIVQEAIDKLSENKTVITIAHRLSTIKNCDRIIVIDNHEIAEEGTHDELIKLGGIYSALNK